jgi:hypothetical protein
LSLLSLADYSWDQAPQLAADILANLHSQNLGRIQLTIEELHDALQLGRNLISNKDHPNSTRLKVGPDLMPELIGIAVRI